MNSSATRRSSSLEIAHPEDSFIEPELSENAIEVLERRYLKKDSTGKVAETPKELFLRVAKNVAQADLIYDHKANIKKLIKEFYELMARVEFLPNSPTLMNAGRELQQLSACFVLPISDSMDGIFSTLKHAALIHKSGGGTGFSFSNLRPKNDVVQSTKGISSGPVSFLKVYNSATEAVRQGGTRRGANMGILSIHHPDILEFIECKENQKEITNFNLSVAITEKFMKAYYQNEEFELINPRNNEVTGKLSAREVFDKIAHAAWRNGEPGLFFVDRTNEENPTPHIGRIEATNPCGEQPLLPYESCNLGSINLEKHLVEKNGYWEIDWKKLERTVKLAVHFLDNVIDMNHYPLPEIERMTKGNRKIGLGIMGFARMLYKLGIPYDSNEGVETARKIMRFIKEKATEMSEELAKKRGVFPHWYGSTHERKGRKLRNATLLTIAPTGTISMIAETSGGCEPEFSLIWYKNVMDGTHLPYIVDYFIEVAKKNHFWSDDLMKKIIDNHGSVRGLPEVLDKYQKIFATAHDVSPEWHVRMQAAFQEVVDNAVSKTINLPNSATVEDVKNAYLLAYQLGCKGITVYRDKSREEQVLNIGRDITKKKGIEPRPRPGIISGQTQKIHTGYGSLFVTINEDEEGMFELFAQIGRGGGYTASFTEALARLISLCLRCGIAPEKIIDQLEGIRGPQIVFDQGERIDSIPDALAKAIKRHITRKSSKGQQLTIDVYQDPNTAKFVKEEDKEARAKPRNEVQELLKKGLPECPECGRTLTFEEGCVKCRVCKFSECG